MGWIAMAVGGFTCGFIGGTAWASVIAHARMCALRDRMQGRDIDTAATPPSDARVEEMAA